MDAEEFLSRAGQVLRERASIATTLPDVPTSLTKLLDLEGLGPVLIEHSERRHGGLRVQAGRDHPVVYRRPGRRGDMTPRERYTVAHEIAHSIVQRTLRSAPSRSREYWGLEDLCNEYAAEVLMPVAVVSEIVLPSRSLEDLLDGAQRLATLCRVSLEASMKRVVGLRFGTAAWGLTERAASVAVSWSVENPEAVGVRAGSLVKAGGPFASALPQREATLVGVDFHGLVGRRHRSLFRRISTNRSVVVCFVQAGDEDSTRGATDLA